MNLAKFKDPEMPFNISIDLSSETALPEIFAAAFNAAYNHPDLTDALIDGHSSLQFVETDAASLVQPYDIILTIIPRNDFDIESIVVTVNLV